MLNKFNLLVIFIGLFVLSCGPFDNKSAGNKTPSAGKERPIEAPVSITPLLESGLKPQTYNAIKDYHSKGKANAVVVKNKIMAAVKRVISKRKTDNELRSKDIAEAVKSNGGDDALATQIIKAVDSDYPILFIPAVINSPSSPTPAELPQNLISQTDSELPEKVYDEIVNPEGEIQQKNKIIIAVHGAIERWRENKDAAVKAITDAVKANNGGVGLGENIVEQLEKALAPELKLPTQPESGLKPKTYDAIADCDKDVATKIKLIEAVKKVISDSYSYETIRDLAIYNAIMWYAGPILSIKITGVVNEEYPIATVVVNVPTKDESGLKGSTYDEIANYIHATPQKKSRVMEKVLLASTNNDKATRDKAIRKAVKDHNNEHAEWANAIIAQVDVDYAILPPLPPQPPQIKLTSKFWSWLSQGTYDAISKAAALSNQQKNKIMEVVHGIVKRSYADKDSRDRDIRAAVSGIGADDSLTSDIIAEVDSEYKIPPKPVSAPVITPPSVNPVVQPPVNPVPVNPVPVNPVPVNPPPVNPVVPPPPVVIPVVKPGAAADVYAELKKPRSDDDKPVWPEAVEENETATVKKARENAIGLIQRAAAYIVNQTLEASFNASTAENDVNTVLNSPNFKNIYAMFEKMRPVHRADRDTFVSIANSKMYYSSEDLYPIVLGTEDSVNNFMKKIISVRFKEKIVPAVAIKSPVVEHDCASAQADPSMYRDPISFKENGCKNVSLDNKVACKRCIDALKPEYDGVNEPLRTEVKEFMKTYLSLKPSGVGFGFDAEVNTTKRVFSIIGINMGNYGNISVVFKQQMLNDPKTWTTPMAAIFYQQGSGYGKTCGRPWVTAKPWASDAGKKAFNDSKVFGALGNKVFALVMAVEMFARVVAYNKDNSSFNGVTYVGLNRANINYQAIDAATIRELMERVNSHYLPEVHLPTMMLNETEKVVTIKSVCDGLKSGYSEIFNYFNNKKLLECVDYPATTSLEFLHDVEKFSAPQ